MMQHCYVDGSIDNDTCEYESSHWEHRGLLKHYKSSHIITAPSIKGYFNKSPSSFLLISLSINSSIL